MIPVLYEHDATTFNSFGIGALRDTVSCEVTEERNGKYEVVIKYPVTGQLYSEIQKERIVRVQVNDSKSIQAFRIYRITAPISGIVTIYAQHISYDLSGVVVFICNFSNSNPSQILNFICQRRLDRNINFTLTSDLANTSDFSIDKPKTLRSVLGAEKDSLVSTFGGELEFDNFNVYLKANRGADNGVTILYGKNLTKLEHNSDISTVYTHLCPYAIVKNGDTEQYQDLTEKVLPIVTTLNEKKVLIMDFSSYFGNDLPLTEANLRSVAQNYLIENPLGIEMPNSTLSFEELRNQRGYSNLHETVKLCDTVTVKYPELGVNVKTKIVKVVYDSLLEKFKTLTLGAIQASLNDKIVSIESGLNDANEEIKEVPNHIQEAVNHATDMITGANGGCVVLDLDSQNRPYELLVMDDYSKDDATKVWRWNINGLGYSPNGYNGPYTTAITADGHIVADFIDTGTLDADIIKAGTIQALTGDSYWDLESGNLHLTGDINATSGSFSNVTINDSCSIYGNLYLDGQFTIYYYTTPVVYDFETRIGGDAIETTMTKTSSGRTYSSKNYITPVGMYTIPNDVTSMDDTIQIGLAKDYSLSPSKLISGFSVSRSEYQPQYGGRCSKSQLMLIADSSTLLTYSHEVLYGTENGQYAQWGIGGTGYNIFAGEWRIGDEGISGALSCMKAKAVDMGHGVYNYGAFYGRWYWGDSCYFLISSSYVDIRGTWKTNGNNWISTSDKRTKNTIEELDDRYSVLFSNLQPRSFKYNEGESGRKHTGFVVQEVLEAMEKADITSDEYGLCCAFGNKDDPETIWGLRYEELIALCVKEIQLLNKKVKELEEKK